MDSWNTKLRRICLKSRRLPGWRRMIQLVWAQSSINPCSIGSGEADSKALYSHAKSFHAELVTALYSKNAKHLPSTSKIQELQRVQILRKAAEDDHEKGSCRHGVHTSKKLTFCQLRLPSSDKERVSHKWTAKWSHHFGDKLNLLQDAHSDTHRQDWCFLESQGFWHPYVPATDSLNGCFRDL